MICCKCHKEILLGLRVCEDCFGDPTTKIINSRMESLKQTLTAVRKYLDNPIVTNDEIKRYIDLMLKTY